jgi:hypothetical protein
MKSEKYNFLEFEKKKISFCFFFKRIYFKRTVAWDVVLDHSILSMWCIRMLGMFLYINENWEYIGKFSNQSKLKMLFLFPRYRMEYKNNHLTLLSLFGRMYEMYASTLPNQSGHISFCPLYLHIYTPKHLPLHLLCLGHRCFGLLQDIGIVPLLHRVSERARFILSSLIVKHMNRRPRRNEFCLLTLFYTPHG